MAAWTRAEDALRRRELAATRRAAQFARQKLWERNLRFLRRGWPFLGAAFLLITAGFLPLALRYPGRPAWFIMGTAVATAFWLTVGAVWVFSGTIDAFTGLIAETATAEELHRLRRRGWRLVNGLGLRGNTDIDHIAVGPAGVLVIETKHSDEPWPLDTTGTRFMVNRLAAAKDQVRRNTRDVALYADFRRAIAGAPVRPILVLHSSAPAGDAPRWIEEDGITIVRDGHLREWLATLDGVQALDPQHVVRVWTELSKHADRRDQRAALEIGPPKPTLTEILFGVMVHAPLGFLSSAYVIANPLTRRLGGWAFAVVLCAALAVGVRLHGFRRLRWFATGWLLGCLVINITLIGLTARFVVS